MRSNERLQRILASRQLGGGDYATAGSSCRPAPTILSDLRLFALTFAGGFVFISLFIA
jgi:hypothetical protein